MTLDSVTYDLYVESGPRRRKTMVHMPDLLGCIAVGPTTEEALAATPEAIRAFHRFVQRYGETFDLEQPIATRVVEHVTQGEWLGNGSPYVVFAPDLEPLGVGEVETYLRRFRWMREELAVWAKKRANEQLDAQPPGGGRTARAIILHIIGSTYLSNSLVGGAPGFSAVQGAAERCELDLPEALRRTVRLAVERVRAPCGRCARRCVACSNIPGSTWPSSLGAQAVLRCEGPRSAVSPDNSHRG
jgi:predicted RNase H-like HicB family nuclease